MKYLSIYKQKKFHSQLFNKDERSVEKSFDILSKYEKASGSRINYNKTKSISIGNARHRKPKFNKISWTKENVKTLGVHHGYNVDNDKINHTHATIFYI
jgi:hypothetical protein